MDGRHHAVVVIPEDIVLCGEDAIPGTVLIPASCALAHSDPIVFNQHILDVARTVPGYGSCTGAAGARGLDQ